MAKAVPIAAGLALSQMGKDSAHTSTGTNTVNPWGPTVPYLSGGVQDLTRIYLGNQGGGFGGGMYGGAGGGASGTPGVGGTTQFGAGTPQFGNGAPLSYGLGYQGGPTGANSIQAALGASMTPKMPTKTVTVWDPSIRRNTDYGPNSGGYRTTVVPVPDAQYIANSVAAQTGALGGGGQGGGGVGAGGGQGGYNPFSIGGVWDTANNEYMKTLQGDYVNNIKDNPYIQSVIDRSLGDVASRFEGYGRYGSGANADAMMNAAGMIRYQDYENKYNQERAAQLAAMGNAPAWAQTPYQLNAAQVAAPYENIKQYLGLLSPLGAGMPTNTSTSPYYTNPMGQALGAASTGVGMYSQLRNAGVFGGSGGGYGSGIGTAAGGAAGLGGYGAAGDAAAAGMGGKAAGGAASNASAGGKALAATG